MEKPEVDNIEEYQASVLEKAKVDEVEEYQASDTSNKQKNDKDDASITSTNKLHTWHSRKIRGGVVKDANASITSRRINIEKEKETYKSQTSPEKVITSKINKNDTVGKAD